MLQQLSEDTPSNRDGWLYLEYGGSLGWTRHPKSPSWFSGESKHEKEALGAEKWPELEASKQEEYVLPLKTRGQQH